jgi:hypothetical protein
VPAEKNLGDFAELFPARAPAGRELERELFEASHLAAIDAHEVWMFQCVIFTRFTEFESPKLVAQIELGQQSGFGELVEYAVDGRLVEAELAQGVDDLTVAQRFAMVGKILQHTNPRSRAPQARAFQDAFSPGGVVLLGFFGGSGHGCLAKTW